MLDSAVASESARLTWVVWSGIRPLGVVMGWRFCLPYGRGGVWGGILCRSQKSRVELRFLLRALRTLLQAVVGARLCPLHVPLSSHPPPVCRFSFRRRASLSAKIALSRRRLVAARKSMTLLRMMNCAKLRRRLGSAKMDSGTALGARSPAMDALDS